MNSVYNMHPGRIVFGPGTMSRLEDEADRLSLKRVMVLSTGPQQEQAMQAASLLGDKATVIYDNATMHTPVEVTEEALSILKRGGVDGLVVIGGGSTTGLSKALALRTDLPQIIVPTTYAGSEMTPILGDTRDGEKTTQSSPSILPDVAIYEVELTMTLPVGLSVTSGVNAMAHAVEALYAHDRNPMMSWMALEGIKAFVEALPKIVADPSDRDGGAPHSTVPGFAAFVLAR